MNYIAEINAFERLLETVRLKSSAQLLWYKLISIANRGGWPEWVEVDNGRLLSALQISDKTLNSARDKLIEIGVLRYKRGKGRNIGNYQMISLIRNFSVSTSVSNSVSSSVSTSELSAKKEKKQKKEINNIYINKTKTEGARRGKFGNVNLSEKEYAAAVSEMGKDFADQYIDTLSCHMAAAGKTYHNHLAIMLKWFNEDRHSGKIKPGSPKKSRYDYDEIERRTFLNVTKGDVL